MTEDAALVGRTGCRSHMSLEARDLTQWERCHLGGCR